MPAPLASLLVSMGTSLCFPSLLARAEGLSLGLGHGGSPGPPFPPLSGSTRPDPLSLHLLCTLSVEK